MRAMASDFFATNPLMAGPQVAMLIFLAVFGVVVWRVLRARSSDYEAQARLPLCDESSSPEARENGHD